MRRSAQFEFRIRTWGGRREGAGRKPTKGRRSVPHRRRTPHDRHCPAHVTLRACSSVPSLRHGRLFIATSNALRCRQQRPVRVLHFSVQCDHLHLMVEANGPTEFQRGLRGLAVRIAKAVNRALGRHGRVWADRYHARLLQTPREVRNGLVYVLQNVRKHIRAVRRGIDPRSSARWFDGWRSPIGPVVEPSPVAKPRTWLLRIGWRRRGLIDVEEFPRPT